MRCLTQPEATLVSDMVIYVALLPSMSVPVESAKRLHGPATLDV